MKVSLETKVTVTEHGDSHGYMVGFAVQEFCRDLESLLHAVTSEVFPDAELEITVTSEVES